MCHILLLSEWISKLRQAIPQGILDDYFTRIHSKTLAIEIKVEFIRVVSFSITATALYTDGV